ATQLVFEPGVTAIVGPNGCGKSNVSDAVRWVLGEQRARLMRGAKMDEVIFQGSSARRAVNVAEVSLHFSNEDGILPVPFKEVVITRRLSRSGDSDYFLNRAPCRLRDIADLLRGTGLGAGTGVVIESKMIDALLSDRPDDRRELFEEAAGVGLYRDRRRTTERRLEETTGDLQRLDDLINEVASQVRSLARQRKRAERHAEIMTRRFTVELSLAAREMEAWREELARLETRLGELRAQLPAAESAALDAEAARDQAHGARAAAEAQRNELSRLVSVQREQVQRIRGEMAVAEERQRNATARRQRAEAEANAGEQTGVQIAAERERAAAERTREEAELAEAEAELARHQDAENEVRRLVAEARNAVERAERDLRELQDRVRRVEHDRERAVRELDEVRQRAEVLAQERAQLDDALALAKREHDELQVEVDDAQAAAAAAASEMEDARAADRETREREALARAELFRADEALTALQGRVNALEQLERDRVGLAPAASRLLRDREQFGEGAVLGPVSDFIAADQASALLVEKFLGNSVHAVLVRDRAVAEAIRVWHGEANPGPLLLLPLDAAGDEVGDAREGSGLESVVSAVGPGRAWVRALLGHVHALNGGSAFVDARGAVWLPGGTTGPGPLRRRAELAELRRELSTLEEQRQEASRTADAMRESVVQSERRVLEATEAASVAQQQARGALERQAESGRRVARATREAQEAAALAERLDARAAELTERERALDADAAALGEQAGVREQAIAQARERALVTERGQEEARELRGRWQVRQAETRARVQMAVDRERRLSQEVSTATQRLAQLREELSELALSDSALAEQMAAWTMDLETREATLSDGEASLAAAEAAVRASDDAVTAADHAVDEQRRRLASASDELHHAELRFTELSGRRAAIRERLETEWKRPLEDMVAEVPPVDLDDDALRVEAAELRRQLEQLGPVNALAIEEHDETMKRHDFLVAQRADLAEAKASLLQAIKEIDATARELFLATFEQVRVNFREIFMSLFGGGECDLRLENPDAPLDCDIEIHASPRGKKTQRIHLLSSGERALVALSLLFGIFLTKPSPFCLLDEVDAPLDDANVGRFVRMLNQFKSRTQFIVITHNPRTTTEAGDAVYGVTMQEPGVSSLVSVRMRNASTEASVPFDSVVDEGAVRRPETRDGRLQDDAEIAVQ
ncbi:MAG TPA: chromosome segregation protein SMC, partial [Gemmatimonadaceae bacterium]|nr:chromosome segregation protein SMC [Gemmatimonadaceae bacterium]